VRVLITGVAGFIGSNLADRLLAGESGYSVIGIDNLIYGVREQVPAGVEFYQMDVRSQKIYPLFKGVECVFHLAAKNCISDCQAEPVETADINITGTVNVFEAARKAGVKKVMYAESSALYEASDLFPTPETELCPESFYADSKAALRYFVSTCEKFSDLRFTALRYFCVYGPRQDYRRTIPPVMSAFIIKLLKNERPVIYGTGEKRRDFVHIDDINDFHLLCMNDSRTDGGVFNLGRGKNYSVLEIYRKVSGMLGRDIEPIYREDLPGEAQITLADITKARELGWEPQVDIDRGLESMVDYIKKEIKKGNIR